MPSPAVPEEVPAVPMSLARALVRRARRRLGDADAGADAGFTVLETVVSLTLFVIVSVGAAAGIFNSINASHNSQIRIDAADVAQTFVASAISQAITIAPVAGKTVIFPVGDGTTASLEQFVVTRWISFDSGGDTCTPGTTFTVNIEVRQAQTNAFLARSDSKVACPPA